MDFKDKILTNGEDSNVKNPSHLQYGKERVISFEYDLDVVLNVGDKIFGSKLPKNCLIKDAKLKCPSMGATGIFSLGILNENSGEDSDGLIAVADAGGQAVNERDGADSDLIGTVLGLEENQLMLEVTEATALAVGKIQAFVTVIVE